MPFSAHFLFGAQRLKLGGIITFPSDPRTPSTSTWARLVLIFVPLLWLLREINHEELDQQIFTPEPFFLTLQMDGALARFHPLVLHGGREDKSWNLCRLLRPYWS